MFISVGWLYNDQYSGGKKNSKFDIRTLDKN